MQPIISSAYVNHPSKSFAHTDKSPKTIAVRDIGTVDRKYWTSPFFWRDQLPRELAINIRLDEQDAYEHSIHRYFGHRLDMPKRRYRVYNEVCEFGNLLDVLDTYSTGWRRRWDVFRWLETHPNINMVKSASQNLSRPQREKAMKEVHAEQWREYMKARDTRSDTPGAHGLALPGKKDADRESRTSIEFDAMSVIQERGEEGIELDEKLPDVIPEGFLWHVFRQLVNAVSVMHEGTEHAKESGTWKEIVHRDIHLMNIFVKPAKNGEGTFKADMDNSQIRTFRQEEVCRLVISHLLRANESSGQVLFYQTLTAPFSIFRTATMATPTILSIT